MRDLNKIIISGRAIEDCVVRYTAGNDPMAIARYRLAVNRPSRDGEEGKADFLNCVAFGGRSAEFAEKFVKKGVKLIVEGHVQTGSYKNKDGVTIPTFEVVIEDQGFAESKRATDGATGAAGASAPTATNSTPKSAGNGFMNLPDGLDEEMPWN